MMNTNLAFREDVRDEMLNGQIVMMSPRPTVNHNRVAFNIARIFANWLVGKPCEAFADGTDVYLTENDRVVPDVMIVCNKEIVRRNGIYGTPDLIVEVISPGTEKRDRGYKKDLYEKCGVGEYWLVDPEAQTVEVYLLNEGKYFLDEVYKIFPDYIELTFEERKSYKNSVPVSLYADFVIPLKDIFYNVF